MKLSKLALISDDETYWLEDVSSGYARLKSEAELTRSIEPDPLPFYFCGHSHLPGIVRVDSSLIVNVIC